MVCRMEVAMVCLKVVAMVCLKEVAMVCLKMVWVPLFWLEKTHCVLEDFWS